MPADSAHRLQHQPTWRLPPALRRILLLAPPLVLAGLEVIHPQPEVNARAVMDVAGWFLLFHVLQLVLILFIALSVVLLADSLGRAAAWSTRIGVGLFLVFYSAYDAVAGIATGLAMRTARSLPPEQQEGIWIAVRDWPELEPVAVSGALIGTLGWVVAVGGLAVAARRAGAPSSQSITLGIAAVVLMGGHPAPFGTIAFGSLFVASLLHEQWITRTRARLEVRPRWP